ncbi:MAG TPA: hypothetical protein VJ801_00465 [Polyangia bacterium]|jgi:hypothetical protein|nr:hypothetical protein [Polyangia bacterium]
MGKTACDSLTFQSRCEGTMRVECINDTVFRFDCSLLRSGLTCGLDATGYPDCKPMAAECDMGASESCQDGVISYCSVGLPATFDCRSVGLSGCATQVIGTNTVARCVL